MANIFQDALDDADALQQKLLGPNYHYWKQVNTPAEIGMSSEGSLGALAADVKGLIAYTQLLVTGGGPASKSGQPLGNKFFLDTGAPCQVKGTDKQASRHIYINNVPDGSIPFVSSGLGVNFSTFKGLVPGLMSNAARINPFEMIQAFMMSGNPECQPVTLETIDVNNNRTTQTRYVATADLKNMSPCNFPNKTNPITGKPCIEALTNMHASKVESDLEGPDLLEQLYYGSIGVLGLYLLYKLIFLRSQN